MAHVIYKNSQSRINVPPVTKLTWSTFQPCRWITVLMALQREAFSAVFLALTR
jgi:hypothetical protein